MRLLFLSLLLIAACAPTEAEPELELFDGKADNPSADGTGIGQVKAWAKQRIKDAEAEFAAAGGQRHGSPWSWSDEVVYQIQLDRFNDGDPGNNGSNVSDWQRAHRYTDQRGLPGYHHGGDLQGVINRLDYLAHLGVTSLWITPVLMGTGQYHGYCTTDFTRVDPTFGTAETLRTLVTEAHKRGIRVVLDVVVNHMCSRDSSYDDQSTPFADWAYDQCVNDLNWQRWNGGSTLRGQRELKLGPSFFAPLRNKHFFSRCGHRPGDYAREGAGAMFGDFSTDMLDFNTLNWDFQEIFTDLHKYWIAYADIDGFRVDAAKHVTEDFLAKLSTEIRAYAAAIGKKNFLLVGEVASSTYEQALRVGKMRSNWQNPSDPSAQIPLSLRNRLKSLKSTYLANGSFPFPGLNAVYDFGHSGTAVAVFHQSREPLAVKSWFWAGGEQDCSQCSASFCELAGNGQPQLNWNVLEIHDWPRFAQVGASQAQLSAALGYLATTQGVPVLYYGVEQGLDGICPGNINVPSAARSDIDSACNGSDHARYRQDMFLAGPWRLRSVVPQIDALAAIGFGNTGSPSSWQDDPYLSTSHDLYRYVRRLVAVRKSCAALRRGAIYFRAAHSSPWGGLLAFSRIDGSDEIVVVANSGGASIKLDALHVDAGLHWGKDFTLYRNLLNGFQQATVGKLGTGMGIYFEGGLTVASHSVAIFVKESNVRPYDGGLGTHLCWH
jgi:glycosidase